MKLGVGALEPGVGDRGGATMAGTDDVHGVEIALSYHPAHVRIDEIQPRRRPPVAQKPRLDLLPAQAVAQQGIVEQIDLSDGEIVGRSPIGVDRLGLGGRERLLVQRSISTGHVRSVAH
jgi:hypothetical protein